MINEIREVLEKHKENIPVVAMAELLAVLDGTEDYDVEKVIAELEEKASQKWLVLAERNGYERAIEIVRNGGKK